MNLQQLKRFQDTSLGFVVFSTVDIALLLLFGIIAVQGSAKPWLLVPTIIIFCAIAEHLRRLWGKFLWQ